MKEHSEINRLLPAFCGNDLDKTEREAVAAHLAVCEICRADLADLQATLQLIRTTPEIEPPPWMTARIMARIREEQLEKTHWWQRFFLPLQVKLPLEVLALLVVCVTGYYLTRSVERDLGGPILQTESPRTPQPEQKPAAGVTQGPAATPQPEPAAPQHAPQKAAEPAAPLPTVMPPPPPAAAPSTYAPAPPAFKEERAETPGRRGFEARDAAPAAESYDHGSDTQQMMKQAAPRRQIQGTESMGPAAAGRAASPPSPAASTHGLVRLRLNDPAVANESIRQAVTRAGGTVVTGAQLPEQHTLKVQLPAARLSELLDRLGRLGRVVAQPQTPAPAGTIEIVIAW